MKIYTEHCSVWSYQFYRGIPTATATATTTRMKKFLRMKKEDF